MLRGDLLRTSKFVALVAVVFALAVSGGPARAQAGPANSDAAASATNQPAAASSVKPVNKRFLLSKPTAVYAAPGDSSAVLEHVGAGIRVNVTGITGNWLQLKLRNGKTGYIPVKAAE
jgi:uncharacterized protein YgiM (DUF1202 family)